MQMSFPVPELNEDESKVENIQNTNSIEIKVKYYFQAYSPMTIKGYSSDMESFLNYINKGISDISEHDVLVYLKHLSNSGVKNSTLNRRISSISKVLSIYETIGEITSNPIKSISKVTKLYKPVNHQVNVLITLMDVETVIQRSQQRTSIIIKFLTNTGLRVSEMINITKNDLEPYDTEFMRIRITGKGGKVRFIYITYDLYQQVKDIYDSESIYLFTSRNEKQLSRINIYKQINRTFKKYTGKTDIGPHQLRHFFATHKIIEERKDVKSISKYLGHSNIGITLSTYTHSSLTPEDTTIV